MAKKLIIVSTCTNSKRSRPSPGCRLDECLCGSYKDTAKKWLKNIESPHVKKYLARHLYAGSHWKETLKCLAVAEQNKLFPELWVLSAGHGLVPADYKIASYSATFSPGENSIQGLSWPSGMSSKDRSQAWWKEVNNKRKADLPKSLAELPQCYKKSDDTVFLFIFSPEYFRAVEPELVELVSRGAKASVVSAGLYAESSLASPILKDSILPISDKFKQADPHLDKANVALNAAAAVWLIRTFTKQLIEGPSALYSEVDKAEKTLPSVVRRDVVKMSDEEVLSFIDKHFCQETSSATKLLKALRHKARKSCEQKRFGQLYDQYVKRNAYKGGLFDE
jgi:hypothetical protein